MTLQLPVTYENAGATWEAQMGKFRGDIAFASGGCGLQFWPVDGGPSARAVTFASIDGPTVFAVMEDGSFHVFPGRIARHCSRRGRLLRADGRLPPALAAMFPFRIRIHRGQAPAEAYYWCAVAPPPPRRGGWWCATRWDANLQNWDVPRFRVWPDGSPWTDDVASLIASCAGGSR